MSIITKFLSNSKKKKILKAAGGKNPHRAQWGRTTVDFSSETVHTRDNRTASLKSGKRGNVYQTIVFQTKKRNSLAKMKATLLEGMVFLFGVMKNVLTLRVGLFAQL